MPGLDLPDPCPGTWILGLQGRLSMHSRPPRSFPGANPPPDLRGKMSARPPRKSGGRENSRRGPILARPGPPVVLVLSLNGPSSESRISLIEVGFPSVGAGFAFSKAGFPCLKHMPRFCRYLPECFLVITCTIRLRLQFRGRGSAWVFSANLLFFHARGGF